MTTLDAFPSAERRALEGIAEAGPALVARASAWAAINSGSGNLAGLADMAAVLSEAFGALPGRLTQKRLAPFTQIGADGMAREIETGMALAIQVRPEAPLQLALTGHYDTVFPGEHPFQNVNVLPDGRLNGPGIADMKGGLSLMLAALQAFETLPAADKVGYGVLISPDEEIGSPASAPLLNELGARAKFGLTFEPAMADGCLAGARKGSGKFAVIVRGRAAHSGRDFAAGRNAVALAARLAGAIDGLNGRRPALSLNIARIDGGGPLNIVPDLAILRFEARAADLADAEWVMAALGELVAVEAGREGFSLALSGGFHRPPKPLTPAYQALLRRAKANAAALGFTLDWRSSGGVCEGNNLAAAGCVNIDTLGPVGGALHSAEEWADPASFVPRAQLSLTLLADLASGRLDIERAATA